MTSPERTAVKLTELIEQLDALEAKATPGPWAVMNLHRVRGVTITSPLMSYMKMPTDDSDAAVSVGSDNVSDHHLICALRNVWPQIRGALASLSERQEGQIDHSASTSADADRSEMPEEPIGFKGEIRDIERMGDGGNWTLSMPAVRYLLAVRAYAERAREDAERYRALREFSIVRQSALDKIGRLLLRDELDTAIDAARAKGGYTCPRCQQQMESRESADGCQDYHCPAKEPA